MIKQFLKNNSLLILILFIAAFLRLYRIGDYTEFLGDQGRDVVIIRDLFKKGNLFFIGPQTSIGNMYLGPYFYYLIAPSLFFANFNPIGPAVFIALINILTVYTVYHVSKSWFNRSAGLISAALYAVSPVVIKYSNFIWNPNILPLFSLLFIYFISKVTYQKKPKYLIPAAISFIMALNSHYLALLLLPPVAIILFFHLYASSPKTRSTTIRYLAISFALFVLSLIPQILFDLKHNGQNLNSFIQFFSDRQTTVNLKAYKAIPNIVPIFNQINTSLLAAKKPILGIITSVFLFLGSVFVFLKQKKADSAKSHIVPFIYLLVWYMTGIVGLGLYKQHIYDHYFGFLYPSTFILMGFILFQVISQKSVFLKITSGFFIVILFTLSAANTHLRYPPNRQIPTTIEVAKSILSDSNGQPFNLALLAKQNYDPPYRYFLQQMDALLYDLHDNLTQQLYVICEPSVSECQPINHPQWEIAAFGWSKIDKSWQIKDIKILRLVHTQP